MGSGNNLGLEKLILITHYFKPDVILEKNSLEEIILASSMIDNFTAIAPISNLDDYPNYKLNQNQSINYNEPFQVESIDGYNDFKFKKK